MDEFYDRDEQSDSEVEHISEASEDDDDELSCKTDIELYKRKLRVRYVHVVKVKAKNTKVSNSRRKVVKVSRKKTVINGKNQNLKRKTLSEKWKSVSTPSSTESNLFISKDGTKWEKMSSPETISRVENRNNDSFDKLNIPEDIESTSPMDFFKLFFTDEVCDEILQCTNLEAIRYYNANKSMEEEWKMVDKDELLAFFGLLITAGHMKFCNENYRNFWHPFYGSKLFQATMGMTRFEQLLQFIRFDDKATRSARRKLCPIRSIWDKVTENYKKYYIPSQNLTIDEQLMPCRCR